MAALEIESLYSPVLTVGHIEDTVVVHDPMGQMEFTGPIARPAPLAEPLAGGRVFQNAGIAIAVGDENPAVRTEGNVSGTVELTFGRGLPTGRNLHELLA